MDTVDIGCSGTVVNKTNMNSELCNVISFKNNVTSFENVSFFLETRQYPIGLNLNQKRTLRKAAIHFSLIDNKLYYIGKNKTEKRLVVLDEEGKKQIFKDCHASSTEGGHGGQKKTLEKIESFFYWRGMVKDVVQWVTACEVCRNKDAGRSQLRKKIRTISFNNDSNRSADTCQNDNVTTDSPVSDLYETAIASMEQLQTCLKKLHHYEAEVVQSSKIAEVDIDDMLDYLLAKIIKLVSRRKRDMKIEVEDRRIRSLNLLKKYRKQLQIRLKTMQKFISDVEKATTDHRIWPIPIDKSVITASLAELPRREEIGGIWSAFNTEQAHVKIGKIIKTCGIICEQHPYRISNVLQLPASLRIKINSVAFDNQPLLTGDYELENFAATRSLRLCHCIHDSAAFTVTSDSIFQENQIQTLTNFSKENFVYLNRLVPDQVYAIYISYRDEGLNRWSPWSCPFLASTSIAGYCWGANDDWTISSDLQKATKIVDSPTPLYSSTAQYFPGCRISVTLEKVSDVVHSEDGFALIDQWVQGGMLNQEGTLFLNVEGKLFVNGILCDAFDTLAVADNTVIFDCSPNVETIASGLRMQFTISCRNKSYLVYWCVRNHVTNVYFGASFNQSGSRVTLS